MIYLGLLACYHFLFLLSELLFCPTTYLQFCSRTFSGILHMFVIHIHCLFWALSIVQGNPNRTKVSNGHTWSLPPNVFLKQTFSHSSSVLKLTLVDGPWWQNNFVGCACNQLHRRFFPETKVFLPDTRAFLPVPQFWIVLDGFCWCPHHSRMVRGCNSRAYNPCKPCQFMFCFQLISCGITITCNRFVGFLSTWLFLISWSKNFFWRRRRFFCSNDHNKCCFQAKTKK